MGALDLDCHGAAAATVMNLQPTRELTLRFRPSSLALALLANLACWGAIAEPQASAGGSARIESVVSDRFQPCPDAADKPALAGSLCARLALPLDPQKPSLGRIKLFVRKFPAQGQRVGELWLVAGGPGELGASFYPLLDRFRSAAPGYDLIVPDHRGTGYSTRMCPAEELPASPGGTALQGAEWGACYAALNADPARTRAFSISNAANDLRRLIDRYSSGPRIDLYAVSYGTQLTLRMMQMPPRHSLDGIILDSLVPLDTTQRYDLSRRSMAVDQVGRETLAACDRRPRCRRLVGGSAEAALKAVEVDKAAAAIIGAPPKEFFGALLDYPALRSTIPQIIAGLRTGDTAPLQRAKKRVAEIGETFSAYPQSPSSIPLAGLISSSENNARPNLTAAQLQAEGRQQLFTSPIPGYLISPGLPLYDKDARFGKPPRDLPRTLVMQGDRDPKTPYVGALEHVAALKGRGPIVVETMVGGPHFTLFTAPVCAVTAIRRFLSFKRLPTRCEMAKFASNP